MWDAVKIDVRNGFPMQPPEKRNILQLHMRVEFVASAPVSRADGKADQFRAQPSYLPIGGGNGEAGTPPDARYGLMDAHRPDHIGGFRRHGGDGHKRDREIIDRIAVIIDKDLLLLDEDRVPKPFGAGKFPPFRAARMMNSGLMKAEWRIWLMPAPSASHRWKGPSRRRICHIPP